MVVVSPVLKHGNLHRENDGTLGDFWVPDFQTVLGH